MEWWLKETTARFDSNTVTVSCVAGSGWTHAQDSRRNI